MLRTIRPLVSAALVILVVGLVAGVASGRPVAARPGPVLTVFRAAADYTGLTPQELLAELRSGKSLAQVATGHGKTVAGLKAALHDAVKAGLDKAVADGKVTSDRATERLAGFDGRLDTLVNRAGPPPRPVRRHHPLAFVVKVSSDYVGVTPQELIAELHSGKSLGQVATGHGKTVAGLKSALHDAYKAGLDKAVAAGKLDALKAKDALARFDARLDELVNRTPKA